MEKNNLPIPTEEPRAASMFDMSSEMVKMDVYDFINVYVCMYTQIFNGFAYSSNPCLLVVPRMIAPGQIYRRP